MQSKNYPHRLRTLSPAEQDSFAQAAGSIWRASAGTIIRRPEDLSGSCQLLTHGFAVRYKETDSLPRQVTGFIVSGDFCDLHGMFFERTNFFVKALSDCTLQNFSHASLQSAFDKQPRLAKVFWQTSLIDVALGREWLVNIGRRSPAERVAHLFCELLLRLQSSNVEDEGLYTLPIPIQEIAAAQVLTVEEVEEILQQLIGKQIVEIVSGLIVVRDLARLRAAGQFDPSYVESKAWRGAEPRSTSSS